MLYVLHSPPKCIMRWCVDSVSLFECVLVCIFPETVLSFVCSILCIKYYGIKYTHCIVRTRAGERLVSWDSCEILVPA